MIPLYAIAAAVGGTAGVVNSLSKGIEENRQIKAYNKRLEEAAAAKRSEARNIENRGVSVSEFARSAMLANKNNTEALSNINADRNKTISDLGMKASEVRQSAIDILANRMKRQSNSSILSNSIVSGVKNAIVAGGSLYSLTQKGEGADASKEKTQEQKTAQNPASNVTNLLNDNEDKNPVYDYGKNALYNAGRYFNRFIQKYKLEKVSY